MLYFATSSQHKFQEMQRLLPELQQLPLTLPEIQSMDLCKIAEFKLRTAFDQLHQPVIVDDTGLYLDCLNGFPGPMIKYLLEAVGVAGIHKLVSGYQSQQAIAKTVIGYIDQNGPQFFEGIVSGTIVKPAGDQNFGWDSIFVPTGHTQTYAQMSIDQKNRISHRAWALQKFKSFYLSIQIDSVSN